MSTQAPLIGIIMGSNSDWPVMQGAADALDELGIPWEASIVSAHRTPQRLFDYCRAAEARGLQALIAGAGGAAHLPGMAASLTLLPVIGVPVKSKALLGLDSLLSIVQMPGGIPVATMAIDGARNAGLYAGRLLARHDPAVRERLSVQMSAQEAAVLGDVERWSLEGPPKTR